MRVLLLCLIGALVCAVPAFWPAGGDSLSIASSVCFLLVVALYLGVAPLRGVSILSDPIYLSVVTYFLFLGAGPLLARTFESASGFEFTPWACIVLWVGFGALLAGHFMAAAISPSRSSPRDTQASGVYLTAGMTYTAIGVLGVVGYLAYEGFADFLLNTPYYKRDNPSFYAIPYMLLRPGLFLLIIWARSQGTKRRSTWLMLAGYALLDILWFGPVRGSRHQVITLLLTIIYLLSYDMRRLRLRSIALRGWILAAGLAAVLVWGAMRTSSWNEILYFRQLGATVSTSVDRAAGHALYAPFDAFVRITTSVPDFQPYLYGATFFESLTIGIPRVLWPGKPTGLGSWLQANFYTVSANTNSVPTWTGELYLNYGIVGVVLGMLLTGAGCAVLSRSARGKGGSFGKLIYASTFPVVFDLIWGGSNAAAWHILGNTVPIVAVVVAAKLHVMREARASCFSRVRKSPNHPRPDTRRVISASVANRS